MTDAITPDVLELLKSPELVQRLRDVKASHDAGRISALDAGIQQMEILFSAFPPTKRHPELISALKAFAAGDDTKLNLLLFGTKHYPYERKPDARSSRRSR